jgi:hypothetical protein
VTVYYEDGLCMTGVAERCITQGLRPGEYSVQVSTDWEAKGTTQLRVPHGAHEVTVDVAVE